MVIPRGMKAIGNLPHPGTYLPRRNELLQFTLKPAQMCVAALVLWAGSWTWQDSCPVPTSTCPRGHMAGSPGHAGAALPWPWALVPVHTPQAPAFVLTPPQKSIPPRPFLSHLLRSHCCPPCTGLGVPGLGTLFPWTGHPSPGTVVNAQGAEQRRPLPRGRQQA